MRRTVHSALAAGAVALATALPAQAQDYRFDIGVNGGGSWYSNSLDEDHLPGEAEAQFDAGWLVGGQLTYWLGSRLFGIGGLGIRANGTYTDRPFDIEDGVEVDGDDVTEIEDVNLWSLTGDLLFRFGSPNEEWEGTEFLPYLALGLGAKFIDPAFNNFEGEEGTAFVVDDEAFLLEDDTQLMGLVGLGTDIRFSPRFALRAEVGDRIWDTPVRRLGFLDDDDDIVIVEDEDDVGNVIHELYGQLGLHFLLGLERPEEVAVVAPPAPPPPPAEEVITVCVIDPSLPGGIAEVQAIYVPSTGDTLVTMNGQRVEIGQAVEERVVVVEEADWFVAGEPLTLTVNGTTTEFVTYGGGRVIEPDDLAFLGTVNGLPVYADADEVQDVREELEERREAAGEDDLEDILEEEDDLREDFEDIEVLYVPLQPVGCVFQPVRRVEEVRKVRG